MEEKSGQPTCCYGSQFNEMRLNGGFVDMEIIVGSETFRVHRVIMATKSDYFRAVMSSELKEAKENRVIIKDLDPEIMKTVIEFCYTNQVSLNDDNFHQVLSAAFRFCMESLKDVCMKFIEPRTTASNFTGLIHSFHQFGLQHLLDRALGFCLENFDLVCETPEFFDIDEDIWEILLPDDKLNLSESGVFRALIKWTEHDLENRKAAFERLVKHVRFATIDASELSELCSLELATVSESCKELIATAKNYLEAERLSEQSEGEPLAEVSATPRRNLRNCQRIYSIGGIGTFSINTLSSVEIYNPITNHWTEAAPMHSPRYNFGYAVLDDHIYVAGGCNENGILTTFERYSIGDNTWQTLPNMLEQRYPLQLVALGGYLYAIGLWWHSDGRHSVNIVERFRPGDTEWHSCAPMLIPRSRAAYVALDGYIYAIGGENELRPLAKATRLERYDPKTDSWCPLSSLSRGFDRLECTCYKGLIYIMGWYELPAPHLEFFVYNPSRNSWYELARAPVDRRRFNFFGLGRELYAVGWQPSYTSYLLESYNRETKQWTARTRIDKTSDGYGLIVHPQRNFPVEHLFASLLEE